MCKENKYINIQTGEELDLEKVKPLPDNIALKVNHNIWLYWDFQKNLDVNIFEITKGSANKYWWYCQKCDDSYPQAMNKKVIERGCSICKGYYCTKKNSFGGKFPELLKEWNYDKNVNISPFQVSYGSGKKVWWNCLECGESYENTIDRRTSQNAKCPYCRGFRVGSKNNLAYTHPEIASMWDYSKNENLLPQNIIKGSNIKVHWKCNKCGHESFVRVVNKVGCKVCSNQEAKMGVNDIATTNPFLAKYLLNKEDSFCYSEFSGKKVDWKCIDCDTVLKQKKIADINRGVFPCPICSDGVSFGEKVLYNILILNNIEFEKEKEFTWSNNKRYDFYIKDSSTIIEVHGEQHYNGSFSKLGGRTLDEEITNDLYKEQLAKDNGIEHYIQIKSIGMDLEKITKELLESEVCNILNINMAELNILDFTNSLFSSIVKLWNTGYSVMQIASKLKISKSTVRKYLKLGNNLNKCTYSTTNRYDKQKRRILKVDFSFNIITSYSGLLEAKRNTEGAFVLLKYPFNKKIRVNEYIFVYEDEFYKYNSDILNYIDERNEITQVCQINMDGQIINTYTSISDASSKLGFNYSNLHACCSGKYKTAYGYKWMFLKDYKSLKIIS